ncbi:MAG: PKD domain-containing protein, partial [Bacteroidota bacterium]
LWFDSGGNPRSRDLADPLSPVDGENFDGYSALGGFFLDLPNWPEEYQNKLLFYDYSGFIQLMTLDDNLQPTKIEPFHNINGVHTLVLDQYHNRLLFLTLGPSVGQITFGGNPGPVAVPLADRNFGGNELTVNFNAYASYDPNDALEDLDFRWSFPDGSSALGIEASHTFNAPGNDIQTYQVYLTATDPMGVSHTDSLIVSLNNSPPEVDISSFNDGDFYPVDRTNLLELRSEVFDAEHANEELSYEWQVYLHHNDHYHPEPLEDGPSSFVFLGPPGCDGEIYFFRIRHRVTDPEGLYTEVEENLQPDCDPAIVPPLEAISDPEGVDLSWELPANPQDFQQLELQRSNNYFNFTTVAELTTDSRVFRDESPLTGNNIYRLKLTGTDQVINYSNLVMVAWPVPYQFTLSPNPNDGRFQLSFNDPFSGGALDFQVYDQIGRHLQQLRWFSEESEAGFTKELDISNLPAGVYWYTLEGEGIDLSGRILVRK